MIFRNRVVEPKLVEKLRLFALQPVPVGNLIWLAINRESGDAVV